MKDNSGFCPYVGLRPFTKDERRYFFGRERELRVVFSNLAATPLTVLYGPSGTGKSSLLHAGLIPIVRLQSRRIGIVYFNRWQNASFLDQLKEACIKEARCVAPQKDFSVDANLPLDRLLIELHRHLIRPMLIVLDQFEEYLLYHPESERERPFETELARAVALRDCPAGFLIALREDSLSRLDRFRTRIPNLLGNTLRLQALNVRGAEEAVRKPLKVHAARHPDANGPTEIEDALVTAVLDQVRLVRASEIGGTPSESATATKPPGDEIEAAILQLVMTRLWEEECADNSRKLRYETLKRLKGASQIVATHFDRVMRNFSPAETRTCAAIFRFLVTPAGHKIAYSLADLAESAECPQDEVKTVLSKLVSNGVLRKTTAPERYELLHDILASAITGWRSRYVQSQQFEKELTEREARLSGERRTRALRLIKAAATLLLLFAIFSGVQWWRAAHFDAQSKRRLARLIAARFEEAASKTDSVSGKDLLFLRHAYDILEANGLPRTNIVRRLADTLNKWSLPISPFAFTDPGQTNGHLLTVDERGLSTWWDINTRRTTRQVSFSGEGGEIQKLSRDGRRAVIELANVNETIIWEPDGGKKTSLANSGSSEVLALSSSDHRLLVGRRRVSRTPRANDASPGRWLEVWDNPTTPANSTLPSNVSPKGLLFGPEPSQVIALVGGRLKLLDLKAKASHVHEFGHLGEISHFELSPDKRYVALAETDGTMRLEAIEPGRKNNAIALEPRSPGWSAIGFDANGARVAGLNDNGTVVIWDVKTRTVLRSMSIAASNARIEDPIPVPVSEGNSASTAAALNLREGRLPNRVFNKIESEEVRYGRPEFSPDLRWVVIAGFSSITIHSLQASSNVLADAEARTRGQLGFEDIAGAYGEFTDEFKLGVKAAETNAAQAEKHFRAGIKAFRGMDPGLRFDPEAEARRLTAENLAGRAGQEARDGDYAKAQQSYSEARKLKIDIAPELPQQLRAWALSAQIDRVALASANGDADTAMNALKEAQNIGLQDPDVEKHLSERVATALVTQGRRKLDAQQWTGATALFEQASKLDPAITAWLNPAREVERAKARESMRQARSSLAAGRFGEALRYYADALRIAGLVGGRERVQSSSLAAVGYDEQRQILEIEFHGGAVYGYRKVPPEVHAALLRAPSKGNYFSEHIRGKYSFERVGREPKKDPSPDETGSRDGFAAELLTAAEKAVAAAPQNIRLRQTRAVARALTGDLTGAADDLTAVLSSPSGVQTDFGRKAKGWLEQLRKDINPFTPDILKDIADP